MTKSDSETVRTIELNEIESIVWVDDEGTRYRRTIEDGEIRDVPVEEDRT